MFIAKLCKRLFSFSSHKNRQFRACLRKQYKPLLESLETRIVPALFEWTGAANNGQWADPMNWLDDQGIIGIPGFDDNVEISNATVTVGPFAYTNGSGTSIQYNGPFECA